MRGLKTSSYWTLCKQQEYKYSWIKVVLSHTLVTFVESDGDVINSCISCWTGKVRNLGDLYLWKISRVIRDCVDRLLYILWSCSWISLAGAIGLHRESQVWPRQLLLREQQVLPCHDQTALHTQPASLQPALFLLCAVLIPAKGV